MRTVRSHLHSIRSGWRLACGVLRLPAALHRGRSGREKLISVDIFATLIARSVEDDAAWRAGALECNAVARQHGLKATRDPVGLRIAVERQLSIERAAAGLDPEFTHERVFAEMLRGLGAGEWAAGEAKRIAEWQLRREIAWTYRVPSVADWAEQQARSGKRVVAVSDTRYTGEQLAVLLSSKGITAPAAIYSSADRGFSKFSGRLFDRVAELERVAPREILHVGDDILTDALAPAQRGLGVRRIRRPGRVTAPSLPMAPAAANSDPAFLVGYETIGPILVVFVRMLFDRAARDGVRRLAFVARDGELPFRVAEILASGADSISDLPTLHYVYLSRRSMACALPEFWQLQNDPNAVEGVIRLLRNIRQMGTFLQSFETFFGLPSEWTLRQAGRLNLAAGNERDVRLLLSDPTAIAELQDLLAPMRARLNRYLANEQLLASDTALVDIGWQGSLLKIVRHESQARSLPGPCGYFLGLWSDGDSRFGDRADGLICDQRRSRSLHEGAAYHAAFLLEAVCRENQGVTIGYREEAGGSVRPIFMDAGATREAERGAETTQQAIREGVLAYARWFAASTFGVPIDENRLRRDAQSRLFQLAFFPTANQRAVGRSLIHSEPTSDNQALPLIATPGKGIRGWLRGLRSPWKSGYVYEHGGFLPATLYCFAEAVLSRIPGSKTTLRGWLIREG